MAPEQLDSEETRRLLDTITSLDDLCVLFVNTPQVIVVGDQGSGKSAVLEAVSRIHFPIGDGICTRFPIELVLRRAPKESTYMEILFDTKSLDVGGRSFSRTREPFSHSGFPRNELPAMITRAKEHLGLEDGKATGFSRDVLLVEIEGPDVPSVTLVDLPGVFHSGFSSQLQDWKPVVDDLVNSYMRRPNSIILTVVSADVPLSAHAVLNRAARFDPDGERTIGVITKPDLCPSANIEDQYLRLAKGQDTNNQLPLGWHVLRNRGPKEPEVDFDERDSEEDLFLSTGAGKWWRLPLRRAGVDSLRKNLAETLLKHIKSKLPDLIDEVEKEIQTRETRLKEIGTSRSNSNEMREYLLNISATFHRLAEHAVEGRYNDPFFASSTVQETSKIKFRKLRALLRNLNRAFDLTMKHKGARYKIQWEQDQQNNSDGVSAEEQLANYMAEAEAPEYLQPFLELYDFPDPTPKSEATVNARIERIASGSQGVEFPGLPNSDLIMQLFRDLSEPWRRIAERHVDIVVERTRLFVYHLFDYILEDDKRTRDKILTEYVDPAFKTTTETLRNKLTEILRPYTSGHGLPLDLEFRTGLSKRKLTRVAAQIADLLKESQNSATYSSTSYRLLKYEDVRNIVIEANGMTLSSDFGTDVVIDMMLTHYEASLKTFTDNVIHLVIENCLVSNLPDIFSTKTVTQMDEDMLRRVAEETGKTRDERTDLEDEILRLRLGLQDCQRSRPRNFSEPADTFPELTSPTRATKNPSATTNPWATTNPRATTNPWATTSPPPAVANKKIRVKLPPFGKYAKTEQSESPFARAASTKIDFTTGMKQDPNNPFGSSSDTPARPPVAAGFRFGSPSTMAATTTTTTPVAAVGSVLASETASSSNSAPGTGGSTITTIPAPKSAFGSPDPPKPAVNSVSSSTTASVAPAPAFGSVPLTQNSAHVPSFGSIGRDTTSTAAFGSVPASSPAPATKPSVSLFGTTSASSPAPAPKPSGGLFGGATTSSQSPAPKPSGGLFGGATTSSPAPAPKPSGGLFGGATTSTSSQSGGPPAAKPTGLFGGTTTSSQDSTPKPSGGLFGGATTSSQSSNAKSSGIFWGATTSSQSPAYTGFVFGKAKPDSQTPATTTSLFGAATTSSQSPAPKPSLFGTTTTSAQNTAPKPSLFGTSTSTTTTTATAKPTETPSATTSESSTSTPSKTPSNDGLIGSPAAPPPQPSLFGTPKSSSSTDKA